MMNELYKKDEILIQYKQWKGDILEKTESLPASGSERFYLRIFDQEKNSILGVHHSHTEENVKYVKLSKALQSIQIPCPQILFFSSRKPVYFVEDKGTQTLFDLISTRNQAELPLDQLSYYQKAIDYLIEMQNKIQTAFLKKYKIHLPRFGSMQRMADLNYFKYCFLLPNNLQYNDSKINKELFKLNTACSGSEYVFTARDFQSRNILIENKNLFFIDFQGAKWGHPAYDLSSLLNQARAGIPAFQQEKLVDYYIANTNKNASEFKKQYDYIKLCRLLQVLGAYGLKGITLKKEHFLKSIPPAVQLLSQHLSQPHFNEFPALQGVASQLAEKFWPETEKEQFQNNRLNIYIQSFSYKRGLPTNQYRGHGAGFVFDCRFITNPGREKTLAQLNGTDQQVKYFLDTNTEMQAFLNNCNSIIDKAIENYLSRKFEVLGINFGCTGGQHRSVYAAVSMSTYLEKKWGDQLNIHIEHRESKHW